MSAQRARVVHNPRLSDSRVNITRESVLLLISPKHAIITGTGLPSCPWLLLQGDTRSTEVYQLKYIRADTAYSRALRLIQQRRTVIQNRARVHHERAPQDRQSESSRSGYVSSFNVTSGFHNTKFRTATFEPSRRVFARVSLPGFTPTFETVLSTDFKTPARLSPPLAISSGAVR